MPRSLPCTVFLMPDSPGSVTPPAVLEETETPECRGCLGGVGPTRQELMVLWDTGPERGVWWGQGSALTVPCLAVAEMEELVRAEKLGLCPGG